MNSPRAALQYPIPRNLEEGPEWSVIFAFLDKFLFTIPISFKDVAPEEKWSYPKQCTQQGSLASGPTTGVNVECSSLGPTEHGRVLDHMRAARVVELQLLLVLESGADRQTLLLSPALLRGYVELARVQLPGQRGQGGRAVAVAGGRRGHRHLG